MKRLEKELKKFIKLPFVAPPMFAQALGYEGKKRWYAFFVEPTQRTVMFTNGLNTAVANFKAFSVLVSDEKLYNHIKDNYEIGTFEDFPKHWILVDRKTNEMYVGYDTEVRNFLVKQIGKRDFNPIPKALSAKAAQEYVTRVVEATRQLEAWVFAAEFVS